jgi:hypothetical protein
MPPRPPALPARWIRGCKPSGDDSRTAMRRQPSLWIGSQEGVQAGNSAAVGR